MLHRLEPAQFAGVRPLFATLAACQPMCAAVLAGAHPGRVFVDDPVHPRSALLATFITGEADGVWAFLAGDPSNGTFNRAVNAAFFGRKTFDPRAPVVFLTCDPTDCSGRAFQITDPRPPIRMPRRHFVARRVDHDWRAKLPAGCALHPLDESLLHLPGLALPDDLSATLAKWTCACDRPPADFGVVLLDENAPAVAAWATVDFVCAGAGDLGFFTQPDYRRRGLGTIACAAALESAFTRGLTEVHWTCDTENEASLRTAQKLGLEYMSDYHAYLLIFDEKERREAMKYYPVETVKR
jgi:GNAT superfamily N-acetyltransferase